MPGEGTMLAPIAFPPVAPGHHGPAEKVGVMLTAHPPQVRLSVEARRGRLAECADILAHLVGGAPPDPGRTAEGLGHALLAVAPGRWHLVTDAAWRSQDADDLRGKLAAAGSVIDVTHGFSVFRLAGPDAPIVLRRLARIDVAGTAFPVGAVAQTEIHGMSAQVRRLTSDAFELAVSRSYGESLLATLIRTAEPFGLDHRSAT